MAVIVDTTLCDGIGACAQSCPADVLEVKEKTKGIPVSTVVRPDDCLECGLCVDACPVGAITIE